MADRPRVILLSDEQFEAQTLRSKKERDEEAARGDAYAEVVNLSLYRTLKRTIDNLNATGECADFDINLGGEYAYHCEGEEVE
mgnify:CR=1 FL=1